MPIVNGLTDPNHPRQLYTDIFTLLERYSPEAMDIKALKGKKVAFFGDCASNMANLDSRSRHVRHGDHAAGPEGLQQIMKLILY